MAEDRRLLVSARRHAHRRLLPDRRAARGRLDPGRRASRPIAAAAEAGQEGASGPPSPRPRPRSGTRVIPGPRERPWRSASMRWALPGRISRRKPARACGIPGGRNARRYGLDGGQGGSARRSRGALAGGALASSCWGSTMDRTAIPLAARPAANAGDISRLCPQPRLSRRAEEATEGRWRGWMTASSARGEGLRRYRAGDGEAAGRRRRGIGWQGKHTNLVSRELGSWLFLGEVFTTLELAGGRGRRAIIAAHAGAASMPARPTPSPRPIGSMPGAASPISPSSIRGRSRASCGR